jgi:hypothetical protein
MANVLVVQSKAMTKKSGIFNLEPRGHPKNTTRNAQIAVRNNYINWTEEQRTYL